MTTQILKNSLHELIDQISDDATLQAIRTLLSGRGVAETDPWDRLSPAQRADIEVGLADLTAGRTKTVQEVLSKHQ